MEICWVRNEWTNTNASTRCTSVPGMLHWGDVSKPCLTPPGGCPGHATVSRKPELLPFSHWGHCPVWIHAGPIPGVQQCLSVLLIHQPGGLTGYHFPFIKTLPPLIFPPENQTVSSMIDFLCYRTIYCLYCPSERSVLGFLARFINCWYKASAGATRNREASGSTSGMENWNGLEIIY